MWGRESHQQWLNFAVFRGPDPTAGGLSGGVGPETRHYEGSVLMRFRAAVSGALEAVLEAVLGPVALRCFMEKMHAPVCALFLSFRPPWAQVSIRFMVS